MRNDSAVEEFLRSFVATPGIDRTYTARAFGNDAETADSEVAENLFASSGRSVSRCVRSGRSTIVSHGPREKVIEASSTGVLSTFGSSNARIGRSTTTLRSSSKPSSCSGHPPSIECFGDVGGRGPPPSNDRFGERDALCWAFALGQNVKLPDTCPGSARRFSATRPAAPAGT